MAREPPSLAGWLPILQEPAQHGGHAQAMVCYQQLHDSLRKREANFGAVMCFSSALDQDLLGHSAPSGTVCQAEDPGFAPEGTGRL